MIAELACHLLRRQVRELSLEDLAGLAAERGACGGSRDAEVAELHAAVDGQVDVRRAHVAVHDAERLATRRVHGRVHAVERAQDLARDVHRDADRQALARLTQTAQEPVAVDAVDVLHRQVRLALVVLARVEHLDDVLVRHRDVQARLALEHRSALDVGDEVREQSLDDEAIGQTGAWASGTSEVDLRRAANRDALVEQE